MIGDGIQVRDPSAFCGFAGCLALIPPFEEHLAALVKAELAELDL
jgi:hypothetical protein